MKKGMALPAVNSDQFSGRNASTVGSCLLDYLAHACTHLYDDRNAAMCDANLHALAPAPASSSKAEDGLALTLEVVEAFGTIVYATQQQQGDEVGTLAVPPGCNAAGANYCLMEQHMQCH